MNGFILIADVPSNALLGMVVFDGEVTRRKGILTVLWKAVWSASIGSSAISESGSFMIDSSIATVLSCS